MLIIDSSFYKILGEESALPFDWVNNNCAQFCGRVYSRIYNKDFLAGLREGYSDALTAMRFVKNRGGWEALLNEAGFERVSRPQRGDVVIVDGALAIWDGRFAVCAGGAVRPKDFITNSFRYKGES